MKKLSQTDKKLLNENSLKTYEDTIEDSIMQEIEAAKKARVKQVKKEKITDSSKLSEEELFSEKSVFLVYNREQKTENRVNGLQAKAMLDYAEKYYVKFIHYC